VEKSHSLKQTNAVKNVSQGALVPASVSVELTVVGAHLHVLGRDCAVLGRSHVFFQGAAAAQVGDVRFANTRALFGHENFQRRQVPVLF